MIDPAEHVEIAVAVARRYARARRLDYGEVLGDAYLGLVAAARRFDPSRGVSFKTYAGHRVMGAILDAHRTRERPRTFGGTRVPRPTARLIAESTPARQRPVGERLAHAEQIDRQIRAMHRRIDERAGRANAATDRRLEVVALLLRGHGATTMARLLGVSDATVTHELNMLRLGKHRKDAASAAKGMNAVA